MALKGKREQTIRNAIRKRSISCRETRNFLAGNKLRTPLIADMLRSVPCEVQRDLLARYGSHIPQVGKKLFDDVAGEWFAVSRTKAGYDKYRIIDDLKQMLTEWGFHTFYEKHKKRLSFNVSDELIDTLNIYFCLDELFESQINRAHETPVAGRSGRMGISGGAVRDSKLVMLAETSKTFFIAAILNIQLKWMLGLMDLAYLDGSMRASLDSEEYENFNNMHQAVSLSSIDELVDMLEMFPPHASRESVSALRVILKDMDERITQIIEKERKRLLKKR